MRATFVILVALIHSLMLLSLYSCSDSKVSKNISEHQPSQQQLETDGQQIVESFLNTVEMYRQSLLADTVNLKASVDPSNFYEPYAERITTDGRVISSPLPISSQLKVSIDTIVYSQNKNFCFALLIIESNYSKIKGLENKKIDHPYDACAVIGYKFNDNDLFNLYPVTTFKVVGVDSYADAKRIIRDSYFRNLKKTYGGVFSVFNGTPFGYNLGDSQFFEKAPFFQKYDSLRYNFQMYHNLGEDYEYPQFRWNDSLKAKM